MVRFVVTNQYGFQFKFIEKHVQPITGIVFRLRVYRPIRFPCIYRETLLTFRLRQYVWFFFSFFFRFRLLLLRKCFQKKRSDPRFSRRIRRLLLLFALKKKNYKTIGRSTKKRFAGCTSRNPSSKPRLFFDGLMFEPVFFYRRKGNRNDIIVVLTVPCPVIFFFFTGVNLIKPE